MILKCVNCGFISPKFKVYNGVPSTKPGCSAAAVNLGFHVGLQETPMGNTRARLVLTAIDIPPPP
jgi:hypothetical protein